MVIRYRTENADNVIIAGTVAKDPVVRETKKGDKVVGFSVRTGYNANTKSGQFMDVDVWGNGGRGCAETLCKGDGVAVAGILTSRVYNGKTYWSVRADWVMPDVGVISAMIPQEAVTATQQPQESIPDEPPHIEKHVEPEQQAQETDGFTELDDDTDLPF